MRPAASVVKWRRVVLGSLPPSGPCQDGAVGPLPARRHLRRWLPSTPVDPGRGYFHPGHVRDPAHSFFDLQYLQSASWETRVGRNPIFGDVPVGTPKCLPPGPGTFEPHLGSVFEETW